MEEPKWLDEDEYRALWGWVTMGNLLHAELARDLLRETGLSDADYAVLVHLSERDDHQVRMSDLAALLRWSKSRLSHQVGRMQARGLVERRECPSDARGAFAALTDDGWREIQRAAPHHVASVRRHLIDLLDRDQLAQLASISDTVLGHLGATELASAAGEASCPVRGAHPLRPHPTETGPPGHRPLDEAGPAGGEAGLGAAVAAARPS